MKITKKIAKETRPDELERLVPFFAKKKVCIVANGESSIKSQYGGLVDSFDVVVRMNRFQISGYEQYVGTKLHLHAFTNQCSFFDANRCNQAGLYYCSDGFLYAENVHPRYNDDSLFFWSKRAGEWESFLGEGWPTTGLRIFIDIKDCDPELIWLLGYDFYENSQYYYKRLKTGERPQFYNKHNPKGEKAYVLWVANQSEKIVVGEGIRDVLPGFNL